MQRWKGVSKLRATSCLAETDCCLSQTTFLSFYRNFYQIIFWWSNHFYFVAFSEVLVLISISPQAVLLSYLFFNWFWLKILSFHRIKIVWMFAIIKKSSFYSNIFTSNLKLSSNPSSSWSSSSSPSSSSKSNMIFK